MDTYKPAYAIKLSAKNFGFEDNKKNRSSLCRVLYLSHFLVELIAAYRQSDCLEEVLLADPPSQEHSLLGCRESCVGVFAAGGRHAGRQARLGPPACAARPPARRGRGGRRGGVPWARTPPPFLPPRASSRFMSSVANIDIFNLPFRASLC